MPGKLRKTLGDVNAPSTAALMRLIETQSRATICAWCIGYAEARILPIFEARRPGDGRPRGALEAARGYLAGGVKFREVKRIILDECHRAARELDADPIAQAAARACGQAAAAVHAPTHSLAVYFYGAAAVAYDRLGLDAAAGAYAAAAEAVCADLTRALRAVAVEDEPNPAKINWHC